MAQGDTPMLRLSEAAVADLDELWLFLAENNPMAADQYLDELAARFRTLLDYPELGRTRDELSTGLRSFAYKNHVIFYRAMSRRIEVVRVLAGRMDLEPLV